MHSNIPFKIIKLFAYLWIGLTLSLGVATSASADTIFDSGVPVTNGFTFFKYGLNQSRAYTFSVTGSYTINSISLYVSATNVVNQPIVNFILYEGANPNTASQIGTGTFGAVSGNVKTQYTASGLNFHTTGGPLTLAVLGDATTPDFNIAVYNSAPPGSITNSWTGLSGVYTAQSPTYSAGISLAGVADAAGAPEIDAKLFPQSLLLIGGLGILHRRRQRFSKSQALVS